MEVQICIVKTMCLIRNLYLLVSVEMSRVVVQSNFKKLIVVTFLISVIYQMKFVDMVKLLKICFRTFWVDVNKKIDKSKYLEKILQTR